MARPTNIRLSSIGRNRRPGVIFHSDVGRSHRKNPVFLQHFLNNFPDSHGHGSLRPSFSKKLLAVHHPLAHLNVRLAGKNPSDAYSCSRSCYTSLTNNQYRRGDLNPHALSGTSPSSWRVCHFTTATRTPRFITKPFGPERNSPGLQRKMWESNPPHLAVPRVRDGYDKPIFAYLPDNPSFQRFTFAPHAMYNRSLFLPQSIF